MDLHCESHKWESHKTAEMNTDFILIILHNIYLEMQVNTIWTWSLDAQSWMHWDFFCDVTCDFEEIWGCIFLSIPVDVDCGQQIMDNSGSPFGPQVYREFKVPLRNDLLHLSFVTHEPAHFSVPLLTEVLVITWPQMSTGCSQSPSLYNSTLQLFLY